jgi:Uma2 family endonuclease
MASLIHPHTPPLQNGDRLDQKTFHERYKAMPEYFRAELIGGVVCVMPPNKALHGRCKAKLVSWLAEYQDATPGTEALSACTTILGPQSEPQPDGCLLILPEYGGQTWANDDDYLCGAPEWIGEISDGTESLHLEQKKLDYEKAGVREYMVAAIRPREIFWHVRRGGKFERVTPDGDGVFRSEMYPGLWLDAVAFLDCDSKGIHTVLREGLASSGHAAFVNKLAEKKRK